MGECLENKSSSRIPGKICTKGIPGNFLPAGQARPTFSNKKLLHLHANFFGHVLCQMLKTQITTSDRDLLFGGIFSTGYFRAGFWQNGFFADFYFWAAGFFRGFYRRIFSPLFCGKKCPEKSSRKIPSKITTTKIPDTFLQRVRPKIF